MKKVYTDYGMWIKDEGDNRVRLGISPWGQDEAGEISFFEPNVTDSIQAGQAFAEIEGAKAITEILAPFDAKILEKNERLLDYPEDLNSTDETKNWFLVVDATNFDPADYLEEDQEIEGAD